MTFQFSPRNLGCLSGCWSPSLTTPLPVVRESLFSLKDSFAHLTAVCGTSMHCSLVLFHVTYKYKCFTTGWAGNSDFMNLFHVFPQVFQASCNITTPFALIFRGLWDFFNFLLNFLLLLDARWVTGNISPSFQCISFNYKLIYQYHIFSNGVSG